MLNLNKLEEKLDQALANETEESLTTWLLNKRVKSYLGEGFIESQESLSCQFISENTDIIVEVDTVPHEFSLKMAA